jgi:2,3-bisphosphoglycerate-independent phosphoglycerate mutase
MEDFSAGHIEQEDAEALIAALNDRLADERLRFHAGVMYRHLMVLRNARGLNVACTPPHDIPSQPIAGHLPRGPDAAVVARLMTQARAVLADHPVNLRRAREGRRPANTAWLWGQGHRPSLPSFRQLHGVRGACIAAVDLIRGIAELIGWPLLPVPGATGYLDTDYAAKGRHAVQALDEFDLVAVHIEAPDEAGHSGDALAKVEAIERIDSDIVSPLLDRLLDEPQWRILIAPDHPTPVSKRTHTADPPPFCLLGNDLEDGSGLTFCEAHAAAVDVLIDPGHALMGRFIARQ